ncbi:hypothetical protein AFLA_001113 [Aspergillus flavus NRRL3357]|nr:hypothetical protein AFLA_001113 [Aspergillus flavus NRRL3357]
MQNQGSWNSFPFDGGREGRGDRQTGAAPAGRANDGNDNMKENPAPTSPPPIHNTFDRLINIPCYNRLPKLPCTDNDSGEFDYWGASYLLVVSMLSLPGPICCSFTLPLAKLLLDFTIQTYHVDILLVAKHNYASSYIGA